MNTMHAYHVYRCSPGQFEEYLQRLTTSRIDMAAKQVLQWVKEEGLTGVIDNDPNQTGPERGVTYVIPDGTNYYYKIIKLI